MKYSYQFCYKIAIVIFSLFFFNDVSAQDPQNDTNQINRKEFSLDLLPAALKKDIQEAKKIEIFNIGTEVLDRNIIVADKVVFNRGALASINNFGWKYVIIMADEFLFADAQIGAQIIRQLDAKPMAPAQPAPVAARPNAGRSGKNGNNGAKGLNGTTGQKGNTLPIPDLWLITNHIGVQGQNGTHSVKVNFTIHVPGIDGTIGGNGGDGGKGGDGGNGRGGSCKLGVCSRGPGSGGNGGQAGSGGRAGDGGDGSNGGNVYYVGPEEVIDILQYSSVTNYGGKGNKAGRPGRPGSPGSGGSRGSRPCNCSGGSKGSSGAQASPAHMGEGVQGKDGEKGKTYGYVTNDINLLFSS